MSLKILLITFLSLSVYIIEAEEAEKNLEDRIEDCKANPTGIHNCRHTLLWAMNINLKARNFKECNVYRDSVRTNFADLWPGVAGSSSNHLRKFGDDCSLEAENDFYYELTKVAFLEAEEIKPNGTGIPIPIDPEISPSHRFFMEKWGQAYMNVFKDPDKRKGVCEPRWLLMCQEDLKCGCIPPYLIEEISDDDDDHDGHIHDKKNPGETVPLNLEHRVYLGKENQSETDDSYRCFPTHGSTCQINLPFVGLCSSNCQKQQECFLGHGDDEEKTNVMMTRRCCLQTGSPMKTNCTGKPSKTENAGNQLEAAATILQLSLISGILGFCLSGLSHTRSL